MLSAITYVAALEAVAVVALEHRLLSLRSRPRVLEQTCAVSRFWFFVAECGDSICNVDVVALQSANIPVRCAHS